MIFLLGEHHVGIDDELDADDVVDSEVVEEPDTSGEGADEEAKGPFEDHKL